MDGILSGSEVLEQAYEVTVSQVVGGCKRGRQMSYNVLIPMPSAPEHLHHAHENSPVARQHLLKLFIASFEHSQGFQRVQTDIFRYLHHQTPSLHLSNTDRDWLTQQSIAIICHLIVPDVGWEAATPFSHVFTQEPAVIKTVVPAAEVYQRILNAPSPPELAVLLPRLTKRLIDRDYRFLVATGGRKARKSQMDNPTSHLYDPCFSYICTYALQQRTTGVREIDALYREVGRHCQTIFAERETTPFVSKAARKLEAVVNTYNRHHPEDRIESLGSGVELLS